jgi:hypothetical protein
MEMVEGGGGGGQNVKIEISTEQPSSRMTDGCLLPSGTGSLYPRCSRVKPTNTNQKDAR